MSNENRFQRLFDSIAQVNNGHSGEEQQAPSDSERDLPDPPDPSENSGAGNPGRARVGIFVPKNTFGNDFADFIPLIEERFGRDVVVQCCDDDPYERNLLLIVEGTHHDRQEMEEQLLRLSDQAEFAYVVSSMGTGYILWKLSDMGFTFNKTIDVAMASHKSSPANLTAESRNAIVSCVGKALMKPPVIITDHYVHKTSVTWDNVLPEFALTIGALLETDPGNRNFTYWSMDHQAIPIKGKSESELSRDIQRATNDKSLYISTEQWTPWKPNQKIEFGGRENVFCVVPNDRDVRIDDDRIRVLHTDCPNGHVLKLRPLDPVWVEREIRHGAMDYIDEKIRDKSSTVHEAFRSHCRGFGKQDPIGTWEMLREQYFDDHLPERRPEEE